MADAVSAASSKSESSSSSRSLLWKPHALPIARNIDGRPVWEPPILNYSHLIDTEDSQQYTKHREAVLKFANGDVVKTTAIIDTFTELQLLEDFQDWATENVYHEPEDDERASFFDALYDEIETDMWDVGNEKSAPGQIFGSSTDIFGPPQFTFTKNTDDTLALDQPPSFRQLWDEHQRQLSAQQPSSMPGSSRGLAFGDSGTVDYSDESESTVISITPAPKPTTMALQHNTTPGLHLHFFHAQPTSIRVPPLAIRLLNPQYRPEDSAVD